MTEKGYDFDDILLVPTKVSSVLSRDEVDLSVNLGKLKLEFPIIASPMKGIISYKLVEKLSNLGGIGIFHRFYEKRLDILTLCSNAMANKLNFGVSCGMNDTNYPNYPYLLGYEPKIICIDIANGYLSSLHKFIHEVSDYISKNNLNTLVMSGNVVEFNGTRALIDAGVNLVRVGIGNGSLCTTRNITGIGVPQLTALDECSTAINLDNNAFLVCDGGIRNSGDIVKALTFGADCVMIGGMLGRTFESAHNGIIYGMASRQLQEEYYHAVKSVEGMSKDAVKDISVEDLISELCYGLRSACTYLDCRNLQDLWSPLIRKIEVGTGSIKRL